MRSPVLFRSLCSLALVAVLVLSGCESDVTQVCPAPAPIEDDAALDLAKIEQDLRSRPELADFWQRYDKRGGVHLEDVTPITVEYDDAGISFAAGAGDSLAFVILGMTHDGSATVDPEFSYIANNTLCNGANGDYAYAWVLTYCDWNGCANGPTPDFSFTWSWNDFSGVHLTDQVGEACYSCGPGNGYNYVGIYRAGGPDILRLCADEWLVAGQ